LAVAAAVGGVLAVELRVLDDGRDPSGRSAYVGPKPAALPGDWNVYVEHGLILAAPPSWSRATCVGVTCYSVAEPWLGISGPAGESLSVSTWAGYDAVALARERFSDGGQAQTVTPIVPGVRAELTICCVGWNSSDEAGAYETRHLFVQLSPDLAADVVAYGTRVAGTRSPVSAQDAAVQDSIASHLALARDTDSVFTIPDVETAFTAAGWRLTRVDDKEDLGVRTTTWLTDQKTVVAVSVYSDAALRRQRDPNLATTSRTAALSARGIGNVLVIATGGDAETRYGLLRDLDRLISP
jgi:hypothetical protein